MQEQGVNLNIIPNTAHLQIETFTVVPSTIDISTPIPQEQFEKRILETRHFLTDIFGGYTSVRADGGYKPEKQLTQEKVAVVYSFSEKARFVKNKSKWIKWARKKRKLWRQESIGLGLEGDMFYVE